MKPPDSAKARAFEDRVFLVVLIAASLAFVWIVWPYFGAILWGVAIAIVFWPLHRRLWRSMQRRRTLAAITTETIILVVVILPVALVMTTLLQEASGLYERIQAGQLDVGRYIQQLFSALPAWAVSLLDRFELTNLDAVQERLSSSLTRTLQFLATQILDIGQDAFAFVVSLFVMLYLLFFLLRDGDTLSKRIRNAIPLHPEQQRELANRFTVVIRATVKGNLVVAVVQGALGALIFWVLGVNAPVLWGVLMAILSLLPAVGAPLIWLPVAIYLLLSGSTWQGIVLVAYGTIVIGLADNILRPVLVGKDTKLPDYLVLISTLGGIAVFGINGFIVGPVIAAMFVAAWDSFSTSRSGGQPDRTEAERREE